MLAICGDREYISISINRLTDEDSTPVTVSAYSKWDSVSTRLSPSERPVVLHRAGTTNTANPFGSTFCYGYQDIIFEVGSRSRLINRFSIKY